MSLCVYFSGTDRETKCNKYKQKYAYLPHNGLKQNYPVKLCKGPKKTHKSSAGEVRF